MEQAHRNNIRLGESVLKYIGELDPSAAVHLTGIDPGEQTGLVAATWDPMERVVLLSTASVPLGAVEVAADTLVNSVPGGIVLIETMPRRDRMMRSPADDLRDRYAGTAGRVIGVTPGVWKPWYRQHRNKHDQVAQTHRYKVRFTPWSSAHPNGLQRQNLIRPDQHRKDAMAMTLWFISLFLAHRGSAIVN